MGDNKTLLILERAGSELEVNKTESGQYILEGIFATFGVENNNKRIYEEKEYLPHLKYLNKLIETNQLMGELDHPEKFEVSLSNVSHIIEKLEYDAESRTIKGKVRLLDTPNGKIAKNLVDSGVPISISSRAAGSVDENDKHVEIKRIFTYDLVAHGGMPNSELTRINESFGLGEESNIQIYDASNWGDIKNIKNIKKTSREMTNREDTTKFANYVTENQMQNFSRGWQEEFKKLQEQIEELQRSTSNGQNASLKEYIENVKDYANGLAKEIEKNRNHTDNVASHVNSKVIPVVENLIKHNNHIVENIKTDKDALKSYLDIEVAPTINKLIKHNNHIVENLNLHIDYTDEHAKLLENLMNHNDYLSEEINKNRNFADYIAENAISNEKFQDLVEYTEYVSGASEGKLNETRTYNKPTSVNDVKNRITGVNEKIDQILNEVKKEKAAKNSDLNRFPITQKLDENNRAVFSSLNEAQKQKVSESLNESIIRHGQTEEEAIGIKFLNEINNINSSVNSTPVWISRAPEKYIKIYESLNGTQKADLHRQAEWYSGRLETDYQIKDFWETRGFGKIIESQEFSPLNESEKVNEKTKILQLGYSTEIVSEVAKALRSR